MLALQYMERERGLALANHNNCMYIIVEYAHRNTAFGKGG